MTMNDVNDDLEITCYFRVGIHIISQNSEKQNKNNYCKLSYLR